MKKRLTENARRHIGETVTIRWGTSRGRDSYGYTTCSLRNQRGERVASCNGGGYDMRGTVIGHWVAATFPNELRALRPEDMPTESHWEPNPNPRRYCSDRDCLIKHIDEGEKYLPAGTMTCPHCGTATMADSRDGKTVETGRRFYGLTFHDPNYDPGKAVIGKDCADRTFSGKSEGKTVEQAEKDGDTVGLERYQAFYTASSKVPTKRHTVPMIDGACGFSSVLSILKAIGLTLRQVANTSKLDVYVIERHTPSR